MSHKLKEDQRRVIISITIDPEILAKIESRKDGEKGRSHVINDLLLLALSGPVTKDSAIEKLRDSERAELEIVAKRLGTNLVDAAARTMAVGMLTMLETLPSA